MPIAVISSLYRFEQHLLTFSAAVFGLARRISDEGISARFLPIVNDPTAREREGIERLAGEINGRYYGRMTPHYVPRETLYASWNRGLAAAQAPYFTFWNADDIRSATAFSEGYRALQSGANLVDFDYSRVSQTRRFGLLQREGRIAVPCMFDGENLTRRVGIGPFFMASKSLYAQVGPFDPNFQVAGDTEWASRALPWVKFQRGRADGGDFIVHGGNLSNTGGDREDIEVNIIFMRRRAWGQLRPANPAAMRAAWERWGNPDRIALPPAEADFLWGPAAERRWKRYQRERRQRPALRRLRLALAARGLLHSVEWAMAQRGRERS
ncbi:MAG: hypothetical protein OXI34_05255 [Chloroflexota bacterium]|nr:hypothetical protein [Chloroflexota bacterium]MDE2947377.1 hypothetical protein [Chloroflexota bacterium]